MNSLKKIKCKLIFDERAVKRFEKCKIKEQIKLPSKTFKSINELRNYVYEHYGSSNTQFFKVTDLKGNEIPYVF